MKILRSDDHNAGGRRLDTELFDCTLFIRRDFTVSSASAAYYEFVGENSFLPFTDLIDEEDALALKDALGAEGIDTTELFTRFFNRIEEGWRNVYVRVENCDRTENGQPLFFVLITDIKDMTERINSLNRTAHKYRFYMSLKDEYYFEYYPETNLFSLYKYVNGKSIVLYSGDYDEYRAGQIQKSADPAAMKEQSDQLARFLKSRNPSFEMVWKRYGSDSSSENIYKLTGGVSIYNPDMVTGVISSQGKSDDMAYYLTSAGKDSFTGLLNKKAATEYSIEKIGSASPDQIMWLIIIDIDDFKNANDNFGHAFGDEVITRVAATLQKNLGTHGVVGRFGGDEFYSLIHDVPTREELKLILKVIARDLMFAFDDKMKLTISVGVSQYPKDGTEFDVLFGKADKSLYIAKEKGKNRHIIYDEKLHGEYSKDSIKYQTLSYLMSREKRRGMLVRCISEMNDNGIESFLANDNLQQGLLDLFDLDGITIYGDHGKTVLLRKGDYTCPPEDREAIARDGKYAEQYDHETVMTICNLNNLKTVSDMAYTSAVEQEIGASVRCAVKKDLQLFIFVDFDVFYTNRKWSDSDVEILTVLGYMIGEMIKVKT